MSDIIKDTEKVGKGALEVAWSLAKIVLFLMIVSWLWGLFSGSALQGHLVDIVEILFNIAKDTVWSFIDGGLKYIKEWLENGI